MTTVIMQNMYDLIPVNKEAGVLQMGAPFPVLLEACGYLFPCVHDGGRWWCAWDVDERMSGESGQKKYPAILSNDGFPVTAEEALIMARIARNFVTIQRTLPDSHREGPLFTTRESINRDDLMAAMMKIGSGGKPDPWPTKVTETITRKIARFAEWAPKSGGFAIH